VLHFSSMVSSSNAQATEYHLGLLKAKVRFFFTCLPSLSSVVFSS
jgi:hypothetical protein